MNVSETTYNNSSLEYETTDIVGWTVKFQPGLWSHSPEVRELLTEDLKEIARLMPAPVLGIMRDTVIYINISFRYPGHKENILGACCHNSSKWLEEVEDHCKLRLDLAFNNVKPKDGYFGIDKVQFRTRLGCVSSLQS